ncbi:MAG TPA: DUF3298 and DUF4163 domain-containing protein [Candidatus Parabacteroides intestinavium]|nr:DUF3298 and DUF4163 domain-containing protein [Candidatus Parabacteroides intestinavium]
MTPKGGQQNKIAFDSTLVDKTYYLLDNPENPHCNLQIKFIYPSDADKALLPEIQKQFVNAYLGEAYDTLAPQEAIKKYTDDYIEAYKDLEEDFKVELARSEKEGNPVGAWFSYYEMSSNTIRFNQDGLLCFSVNFENYTGGAHGAHAYNHFVLNANTGHRISEEDIFVDNYQDSLAEILVAQIAKQNDISDPKELENMGFFSVDEIYPNNNFFVDDTGITYTFNEYEIAAYVVGPVHVHLSFEEVQYLLRSDTPITQLIN